MTITDMRKVGEKSGMVCHLQDDFREIDGWQTRSAADYAYDFVN